MTYPLPQTLLIHHQDLGAQTSWSCELSFLPACDWLVGASGQPLTFWWSTLWSTCLPEDFFFSVWSAGEFYELKIHQCLHLPSYYSMVLQSNRFKIALNWNLAHILTIPDEIFKLKMVADFWFTCEKNNAQAPRFGSLAWFSDDWLSVITTWHSCFLHAQ